MDNNDQIKQLNLTVSTIKVERIKGHVAQVELIGHDRFGQITHVLSVGELAKATANLNLQPGERVRTGYHANLSGCQCGLCRVRGGGHIGEQIPVARI